MQPELGDFFFNIVTKCDFCDHVTTLIMDSTFQTERQNQDFRQINIGGSFLRPVPSENLNFLDFALNALIRNQGQ